MRALRSAVLLVAIAVAVSAASEPVAPPGGRGRGDAARVAALEVHGFRFRAGREQPARWAGSGVWLGSQLLVTAANVVLRAREIVARGADGRAYRLDRVLLLDRVRDLALVSGATGPALPPIEFRARPADTRALRGAAVAALGGDAANRLAASTGHLAAVTLLRGQEWIVHDAPLQPGASGGALLGADGALLGVNTAAGGPDGHAFAVPAWTIARLHAGAGHRAGIPLETVFAAGRSAAIPLAPPGPDAGSLATRTVCMPFGGTAELRMPVSGPGDVGIEVAPERGARVLVRVAMDREAPAAAGLVAEARMILQSVDRERGVVTVLFSNPQGANVGRACATVRPHVVDWDSRVPPAIDLW